jgi:hypothetical protein
LPLPDDLQIGERMLAVGGKRGDRFACVQHTPPPTATTACA